MIKIVHFIYQLSTGGLENGLVNLINFLPSEQYYHIVICLSTKDHFANRIVSKNIEIRCLELPPGPLYKYYFKILNILKEIKPNIVHTRNLYSIELQMISFLAGVKYRIHSEHGRGVDDLRGDNFKNRVFRKLMSPFIHKFISISKEIKQYLIYKVMVNSEKVKQIYNGVNVDVFKPSHIPKDIIKIITVGRMEAVKDPLTAVKAIAKLIYKFPNIEFTVVGEGSMIKVIEFLAVSLSIEKQVICLGDSDNVGELLSHSDIFIQSSLVEGISNTILEAMASGLPVIATDVGGNAELIEEGVTGLLVPAKDIDRLTEALIFYCEDRSRRVEHGLNGRARVEKYFSLQKMISQYDKLYKKIA